MRCRGASLLQFPSPKPTERREAKRLKSKERNQWTKATVGLNLFSRFGRFAYPRRVKYSLNLSGSLKGRKVRLPSIYERVWVVKNKGPGSIWVHEISSFWVRRRGAVNHSFGREPLTWEIPPPFQVYSYSYSSGPLESSGLSIRFVLGTQKGGDQNIERSSVYSVPIFHMDSHLDPFFWIKISPPPLVPT